MATRTASPGASLLRSSRMFSLPTPLPTRSRDSLSAKYASETASTPYPTTQAVTTPKSSLRRGDWGFKRPLPLKSTTHTSTPVVRVKHFDTIEHITDYASSSDLSLTLEKFHELNVPLTQPQSAADRSKDKGLQYPTRSVFEDSFDTLAVKGQEDRSRNSRWKFDGPWLAGISNGAFQKYASKVQARRAEFRHYLKGILAAENNADAAAKAVDTGAEAPAPLTAADITDTQLADYLRRLRGANDRAILTDIVGKFLDLAPLAPPTGTAADALTALPRGSIYAEQERLEQKSGTGFGKEVDNTATKKHQNPYAVDGPPSTHPSAGLSYLRTNAFMENHPLYGPQAKHAPVQARMLKPASQGVQGAVGVGGIVAQQLMGEHKWAPDAAGFDPELKGGKKEYVQVQSARMGSNGKVVLSTWEADKEGKVVAQEMVGEVKVLGEPMTSLMGFENTYSSRQRQEQRRAAGATRVQGNAKSYGFA